MSVRRLAHAARTALRIVSAPAKHASGKGGSVVVQPYRGYGTTDEIFFMGRVFRQPTLGMGLRQGSVLRDWADLVRRIARFGMGSVEVRVSFQGDELRVESDRDGYFHVHMPLTSPPPLDRLWHEVKLELRRGSDVLGHDTADVFIPPASAQFVVISDIDYTVMRTGVVNVAVMMWRLFMQGAESRTAFPGVGAFYRALHRGVGKADQNPMLYVSRGPWSIYEVLEEFFQLHGIPVGPVLFLREWGLTLQRPLPKRASGHKLDLIEDMLARYDELPFLLIGDSGQHDPEIYAEVVRRHPNRILAVYIRNVSQDGSRFDEIEELSTQLLEAESELVLAADSTAMASHAAERGWITEAAVDEVASLRAREGEPSDEVPAQHVQPDASQEQSEQFRDAVKDGNEGPSPNVIVQPADGRKQE
ncbi:MAG: App1 family protein [Bacteroidota bacterium]